MTLLWHDGNFLGIEWNTWKVIGWCGNAAFFSRFVVQWHATERQKRVVIPVAFWWLSLVGSFCILSYAIFYRSDSVFIFANAFNWIPYVRNLVIHRRTARSDQTCGQCQTKAPSQANFCPHCGLRLGGPSPDAA